MKRFHFDEDKGVLRELNDDEPAPFKGKVVSEAEAAQIRNEHAKAFDDVANDIRSARARVAAKLIELGVDEADARLVFGVTGD